MEEEDGGGGRWRRKVEEQDAKASETSEWCVKHVVSTTAVGKTNKTTTTSTSTTTTTYLAQNVRTNLGRIFWDPIDLVFWQSM